MTDREKAVVMAYTGVSMLTGDKFDIFHEYIEKICGRPIWTHELAVKAVWDEIKEKSKPDFIQLCRETTEPIRHGKWIEVENPSYSPFDGSGEHLYVCSRCFMTHPRKSVFCGCCGTQLIETETDDDEFEIKTYVRGKKDIPSDEEVKYTYKKIKEDINAKTRD